MSGQVWFIWMMVALKLPVLGLGYFIYRVLRAQDEAWERGGYDTGPDDSDGGGGGGGTRRPSPSGPRGGPARRRARTARPGSRPLRGARLPAPARRPLPLGTRVRTRTRP